MRLPSRQEATQYLSRQALAQFIAFYIATYSTVIVSNFFETRSVTNLWGLLAHKTVVSDDTFHVLARIVAVIIGFVIFEIISRNFKMLLELIKPFFDQAALLVKRHNWDVKWATLKGGLKVKSVVVLSSLSGAVRNAVKERFSK